MTARGSIARFLTLAAAGLALGVSVVAQAQQSQLPDEVRAWLERDQVQRWAGLIRSGQERFNEGSCYRCHGENGTGGDFGPDLTDADWVQSDGSLEGIRETIFWGVRRRDISDPEARFEMNPQGGMNLEWEEVRALAAYVWSLSNGDHLPRR